MAALGYESVLIKISPPCNKPEGAAVGESERGKEEEMLTATVFFTVAVPAVLVFVKLALVECG